jgi:hypothetical protein
MKGGNNPILSFSFSGFYDKKNIQPLQRYERRKTWNAKPTRILNRAIAVTNRVHAREIAANVSATISDPANFRPAAFRAMRNEPTTAPLNISPVWSAIEVYKLNRQKRTHLPDRSVSLACSVLAV